MEGTGYTCEELTEKGIALAKRAIAKAGRKAYAALDIGSLGKLLEPLGDLTFEEAYEAFKPMCIAGERAGADFCLIETMNDTYEIKAAVLAAKENTSLPIVVTMVFDEDGKLLVANVVLNRMNSDKFPDTVTEVVFQREKGVSQFSPVYNGSYYRVTVSDETVEAVERALMGEDISQGALYFAARKYADSGKMRWFDTKLTYLFLYGGHEFFK